MATTTTPRLGLTVWSAGTDAPTRAQFTGNFDAIDAAVVRTTGGDTITASAAGVRGLVVRGASGQTANLQEFHNDTGVPTTVVRASGAMRVGSDAVAASVTPGPRFMVSTDAPGTPGLFVRGAASQAASLTEWQNSAGAVLARITSAGQFRLDEGGGNVIYTGNPTGGVVAGSTSSTGSIFISVNGVAHRIPYF